MTCVPKAESVTKYAKMTTPQYRCFRTSATSEHPYLFRKFNKHLGCVKTPIYWGVVIFGHFVPDSAFGTHAMLFVMIILPYNS